MTSRPRVLFITPVYPDRHGGGVAQRAYQWVSHLATESDVDVLVVHRRAPTPAATRRPSLPAETVFELTSTPGRASYWSTAAGCATAFIFRRRPYAFVGWGREWAFVTAKARTALAARYGSQRWDRLVAFRLQVADYVRYFAAASAVDRKNVTIDLDDIESRTRASIAAGLARCRRWREAWLTQLDARHARFVERRVLAEFPHAVVCAEPDRALLRQRLTAVEVDVFPNRLFSLPPNAGGPARRQLLFVGTLGYFPNQEAVLFAAEKLLPRLRAESEDWTLDLIGYDAPAGLLQRCRRSAGVRVLGAVDDLDNAYRASGIVIAPLRSGGGTKIKVLEALAHGRPLIATEHAVRGLILRPSVDYWPADAIEEWVAGCRRIAADLTLAQELGRSGRLAVARHYVYGPA